MASKNNLVLLSCSMVLSGMLFAGINSEGALAASEGVPARTAQAPDANQLAEAKRKQIVKAFWAKYHRLGVEAMKKGNYEAAFSMLERAVEEAEVLKFELPETADTFDALSELYKRNGKSQDSMLAAQKALEIRGSRPGNSAAKAGSLARMGELYRESGDLPKAKSTLLDSLNMAKALNQNDAAVQALEGLASMALSAHELNEADSYIKKLIEMDAKHAADQNTAKHLEMQAVLNWQRGELAQANQVLDRAVAIRSACQSPDDPELIASLRNQVRAKLAIGKADGLSKTVSRLLSYDRKNLAPDAPDYLSDLQSLAELKFFAGEYGAANLLCTELLKAKSISSGSDVVARTDLLSLQGRLCAQQKQWHEARSFAEQAISGRQKAKLPEMLSIVDRETLAACAMAQGLASEAQGNLEKVVQLRTALGEEDAGLIKAKAMLKDAQDKAHAATASLSSTVAN